MAFKLWSELNSESRQNLRPDFGLREWSQLSDDEKHKIWKYLETHFFYKDSSRRGPEYGFFGDHDEKNHRQERVLFAIHYLNDLYKAKSYAEAYLESKDVSTACADFFTIFMKQDGEVVLELISLYAKVAINSGNWGYIYKDKDEDDDTYQQRKIEWNFKPFDAFAEDINEVFSHFGINVILTRLGFVPRQEEKIINEIFSPVIKSLSHPKWKEVNQLLADAFSEYQKNNDTGFSNCVTNAVASVQAFLQILVNGSTGSGDISKLIVQAQNKNIVPADSFTKEIFSKIEAILARERQETGVAHPKKEYATERNARLVLNLCLVFFQHCIGSLR